MGLIRESDTALISQNPPEDVSRRVEQGDPVDLVRLDFQEAFFFF